MVVLDIDQIIGKEIPDHVYSQHETDCIACGSITRTEAVGRGAGLAMTCSKCGLALGEPQRRESATGRPFIAGWQNKEVLDHTQVQDALEAMKAFRDT